MKNIDKNSETELAGDTKSIATIKDEATQWLLDLEQDSSPITKAAFEQWLKQSEQHQSIFSQLQQMWQLADELPSHLFEDDLASLNLDESSKRAVESPTSSPQVTTNVTTFSFNDAYIFLRQIFRFFTLRNTMYMASFASSVFVILLTLNYSGDEPSLTVKNATSVNKQNALGKNEYQSDLGEHKSIKAEDGSIITLGAKSKVFIDYSSAKRDVYLVEGEALFTVAKDKNRPFIVYNQGQSVQALGTIFNVKASKSQMQVAVLEGIVEVTAKMVNKPGDNKPDRNSQSMQLVAGQAVQLSETVGFSTPYIIEKNQKISWQTGRLNYVNTELSNVIFDLKRYSNLSIYIPDDEVASLGYTGSVIYDKVDDWLIALPYIFPVEVQRHGGTVVISKQNNSS